MDRRREESLLESSLAFSASRSETTFAPSAPDSLGLPLFKSNL